jgi:hypothetical protein
MPAPSDLDRLRKGELVEPPRHRNPDIPPVIDGIVMRALAGDVGSRYQRAEELLTDLIDARRDVIRRPTPEAAAAVGRARPPQPAVRVITPRARSRDAGAGRFCWNCRKPQPARGAFCPFCGESQ